MAEPNRVQKTYARDTTTPANDNRPPLQVIKGSDRSFLNDPTRNVRTNTRNSTMPGAPQNTQFTSSNPDSATQFNAEYAKQGLQPRGLLDEAGNTPKQTYQQPQQITRSEESKQRGLVKRGAQTFKYRQKLKKRGLARRAFTKVRATAANFWIWGWGFWSWLLFQVPFALLSVVFMALTEFIYQLWLDIETGSAEESLLERFGELTVAGLIKFAGAIAIIFKEITGIDPTQFNPANFFTLTYLVVLLFGWFTLGWIYFTYKISFLRPLSGEGSGMKIGMFLFAFVGYAIPILNIFPLFFFWTLAVWWYPK